ncbi:MAG: hypothetical protein PHC70_00775 [Patescibacteria group bacterium]|nr:hypothetical protein [Patescibacteria group bacterium]
MSSSKPKRYRTYGREFLMLRDKEVRQEQLHLLWNRGDGRSLLLACGTMYIGAILFGLFTGAGSGATVAICFFSVFFIIGSISLVIALHILSQLLRPLYFKRLSAEANAEYDACVHEFNGTVPEGYRRFKLPVSKPTSNDELKVMLDSMPATEATRPLVKRLVRVHADLIATDEALAEIQTQEEASKANAT